MTFNTIRHKPTDSPKSKLIFNRYGEQYFLARIWDGSSETVLKLNKSKAEKKVAKLAKKEENPDEVPVGDNNYQMRRGRHGDGARGEIKSAPSIPHVSPSDSESRAPIIASRSAGTRVGVRVA